MPRGNTLGKKGPHSKFSLDISYYIILKVEVHKYTNNLVKCLLLQRKNIELVYRISELS